MEKKPLPEEEDALLKLMAASFRLERAKVEMIGERPDLRYVLPPGPPPEIRELTSPKIELARDLFVINSCRRSLGDFGSAWTTLMKRLRERSENDWLQGSGLEKKKEINQLTDTEVDQFLGSLERRRAQELGWEALLSKPNFLRDFSV